VSGEFFTTTSIISRQGETLDMETKHAITHANFKYTIW